MNAAMNTLSGALPPSPPRSTRSSNGTSLHSANNNSGGRNYSTQVMEQQLQEHHRVLRGYLDARLREDKTYQPHNRARDKLLRLSGVQFQELSTDVYDELLRREEERQVQNVSESQVPRFLLPRSNFHPKRNQARQKLSSLASRKFRELAADVLYELERRLPRLGGANGLRAISPTGSTTSSMKYGGRRTPPSRPGTAGSAYPGRPSMESQMRHGSNAPGPPPYASVLLENGYRDVSGSTTGNDYARPLPKTFQSNFIVPNKSTMVEDDDDQSYDEDAFDVDGVLGHSRRTTNKSLPYSVRDLNLTSDYQAQVLQLESRIDQLESQLYQKEEELQQSRSKNVELEDHLRRKGDELNRNRVEITQTADAEQTKLASLNADLGTRLRFAENLNTSLQKELDKIRAGNVPPQTEVEASTSADHETNDWKHRYDNLENEYKEQQRLTDQVRQESYMLLQEMQALSETGSQATETKINLVRQVSQLEQAVSDWKGRYARAKAQLRDLKAQSMGLNMQHLDTGHYTRNGGFIDPQGLIKDVSVTKFQIAIDELLHLTRGDDHGSALEFMRTVVACIRDVTEDVDAAVASNPNTITKSTKKLRAHISVAANALITAARSHASANGLSPASLIDAAASNLTIAVVELIKAVKIRPSSPGDLIDDDEMEDGNLSPGEYDCPKRGSKPIFSDYDNSPSMNPSPEGTHYTHEGFSPRPTPPTSSAPAVAELIDHSYVKDDEEMPDPASPPAADPVESVRPLVVRNDETNSEAGEAQLELPASSHPPLRTVQRGAALDSRIPALKAYLNDRTDELDRSVQPLVHSIRAAMADTTNVSLYVAEIAALIAEVVPRVVGAMSEDETLSKHVAPLLQALDECRAALLAVNRQGEIPAVATRIGKLMRAVVGRVGDVESGRLASRDAAEVDV